MQFRKTNIEDITQIIMTEEKYKDFVGQWSFEQHQMALSDKNTAHIIFNDETQEFIGYAILKGLTNTNKSIELMRIAINQPNNGYGKKAIKLLLNWCFNGLHAHRVWLDVREHNVRAQKVYKKIGFKEEGLLRDCIFLDHKYESLFVMSILENEYHIEL